MSVRVIGRCPLVGVALAIVAGVSLPSSPAVAQATTAPPPLLLTLDSAVALATQASTPVQRALFNTETAGLAVLRNYARFLPALTATTGGSIYNGNMLLGARATEPSDTRFRTLGYSVGTSLNVFSVFTTYPAVRAALESRSASELSLTRVRQAIALDVTQVYLQSVLDEQLMAIARQNAAVSEQRVGQFGELVRVGKRAPADLYRVQAQASADESAYIDAENRRRGDVIALLERVHLDPSVPVQLVEPPADTTPLPTRDTAASALIRDALGQRTDLEAARSQIGAARWTLRAAGTENLPSLDVGFGVFSFDRLYDRELLGGVNQLTGPQNGLWSQYGKQTTTLLTVGVSYNFLNLFRARYDEQEARVSYNAALLAESDVRRAVTGDVTRALGDYATSVQRLTTSGTGIAAAQAAYDAVSGRYDVGFATLIDLLTAQAVLAQAQSIRAQAVVEFALRKRAIAYAVGLYPADRLP